MFWPSSRHAASDGCDWARDLRGNKGSATLAAVPANIARRETCDLAGMNVPRVFGSRSAAGGSRAAFTTTRPKVDN